MLNKLLKIIFVLLVFLPITLLIKFISYFYKIKICEINPHLGGNIDLYHYIIKKQNNFFKNQLHIFFINDYELVVSNYDIYNKYWLNKIFEEVSFFKINNKKLFFIFNLLFKYIFITIKKFKINGLTPDWTTVIDEKNWISEKKIIHLYKKNTAPILNIKKYNGKIDFIGEKNNDKIIAINNRDEAYKKKQFPSLDFSYHNFRNFKINDFTTAIENFTKKNYKIVRVGNITEETLNISNNNYYDYSLCKKKSHEIEIDLILRSKFYVGPESGPDKVANFLNVPTVNLNVHHLLNRRFFLNRSIFIPQKMMNKNNGKYFTFRQLLDKNFMLNNYDGRPLGLYVRSKDYDDNNVQVTNSTAEEINSAMEEMNFYLSNDFKMNKEDLEIQDVFWNFFGKDYPRNSTHIISPNFLKKNLELLK